MLNVIVAWIIGTIGWTYYSATYDTPCDEWSVSVPDGWPQPDSCDLISGFGITLEGNSFNWQPPRAKGVSAYYASLCSYGMPMRSMRSIRRHTLIFGNGVTPKLTELRGSLLERGIPVSEIVPNSDAVRRLALLPVPAGFAFNTLFFTGILGFSLYSFVNWRRARRRRQGRCQFCSYPTPISAVCSECGRVNLGRDMDFPDATLKFYHRIVRAAVLAVVIVVLATVYMDVWKIKVFIQLAAILPLGVVFALWNIELKKKPKRPNPIRNMSPRSLRYGND